MLHSTNYSVEMRKAYPFIDVVREIGKGEHEYVAVVRCCERQLLVVGPIRADSLEEAIILYNDTRENDRELSKMPLVAVVDVDLLRSIVDVNDMTTEFFEVLVKNPKVAEKILKRIAEY